ncbi:MAG: FUSC family protein [Oscillospiraceae bacterium]|nr:FUSC family protein [Oscillospiraceae bacterium]
MQTSHSLHLPHVGLRIVKTLVSCLAVALVYQYLLGGRNPCFACIGAVYGMGNQFQEGFRNGFNRFVGTLLGGLMVIPFYWLYYYQPLGIPQSVYLIVGLFCVIYINLVFGANNAIQPGTVVYFVVMFTQPTANYVSYTLARIIDTGVGVVFSLVISMLHPSELDKRLGMDLEHTLPLWQRSNQRQSPQDKAD